MRTTARRRPRGAVGAIATMLWVCARAAAPCDVPVHQYALEHWERDQYVVYYSLADGGMSGAEAALARVSRASTAAGGHCNVLVRRLDPKAVPRDVPHAVRELFVQDTGVGQGRLVVCSGSGGAVYAGPLASAALRGFAGSPARSRIAGSLARDRQAVLLVLATGRPELDDPALALTRAVAQRCGATGKQAAVVAVRRDDPREAWLVRQLLCVEPDLAGIDAPMVYGLIGRARAMPPYVGRGISEANVEALVKLMYGPCSCDIKESHLGMDLLTNYPWERALGGTTSPARPAEPLGFVTFGE